MWSLIAAARNDNVAGIQASLAAGLPLEGSNAEFTPLTAAAHAGACRALRALLHEGADVEKRGSLGCSPLGRAAGRGYEEG